MLRRDFLKTTLGFCAGAGSCLAFESLKNKNKSDGRMSDVDVPRRDFYHIEVPVCHNCNLNCAYCDHFAPLAPKYQVPVEDFERDLSTLANIKGVKEKLTEFMLVGGEPLLHDNIEQLIEITRKYFKKAYIELITNGLLFREKGEKFCKACAQNDVLISISNYIEHDNLLDLGYINEMSYKYKFIYKLTNVNQFIPLHLSLNKTRTNEPDMIHCQYHASGVTLDRGKLYSCCVAQAMIDFFNTTFKDKAIPHKNSDISSLNDVSSVEQIEEFLNTPKTMCKYCNYGNPNIKPELIRWKLSNRELSEWYID